MADIELVIKMPENMYKHIKNTWNRRRGSCPESYIAWGTPLPKGHGNLIDVSQLMTITDIRADGNEVSYVPYSEIEDAPIIIKADKEESEE